MAMGVAEAYEEWFTLASDENILFIVNGDSVLYELKMMLSSNVFPTLVDNCRKPVKELACDECSES